MNEIEQLFYDVYVELENSSENIKCQVPIGIYIADFVIQSDRSIPVIIEIDGHETHKTKEQRFNDYKRERFFMDLGYLVVRFMGSEVFVDPEKCALEAMHLAGVFDGIVIDAYYRAQGGSSVWNRQSKTDTFFSLARYLKVA